MVLRASGAASSVETVQLFTMEEAMTAMTKTGQVQKSYKPPSVSRIGGSAQVTSVRVRKSAAQALSASSAIDRARASPPVRPAAIGRDSSEGMTLQ
jgi:hypothetical protein